MLTITPTLYPKQSFSPARKAIHFSGQQESPACPKNVYAEQAENPITRSGEYTLAIVDSFKDSLKISARAFGELMIWNDFDDTEDIGATILANALLGLAIGGAVFAFTLPKKLYDANVKFFTKTKEMDTYLQANKSEQIILDRLNTEAEAATTIEETNTLSDYLVQVKSAKTSPPSFLLNA